MNGTSVYDHLLGVRKNRGGGLLLLIDPDRSDAASFTALASTAAEQGVDAILVGTSFMLSDGFHQAVRSIRETVSAHGDMRPPVVIFPGSFAQITPDADAVLFTS